MIKLFPLSFTLTQCTPRNGTVQTLISVQLTIMWYKRFMGRLWSPIEGKFLLLNTLFKQVHTNNVNNDCIQWSFLYLLNQSYILQYGTYYGCHSVNCIDGGFNFLKKFYPVLHHSYSIIWSLCWVISLQAYEHFVKVVPHLCLYVKDCNYCPTIIIIANNRKTFFT